MDPAGRAADTPQANESLTGVVRRITFRNDETGFTVMRLETGDGAGPDAAMDGRGWGQGQLRFPGGDTWVTVVGIMPGISEGEPVRVEGQWAVHPRFGRQFEAERVQVVVPETEEGVRRYLASGLVKGVGPATAERLVAHFGTRVLDVIENEPHRLVEVPGIGPKKAALIHRGFTRHRAVERVMVFLQGHGVSPAYAARIWREYGDEAVERIKENPYRLAQDVFGIGFRMADRLARALGVEEASPLRLAAGLLYVLDKASAAGHVYLPRGELVEAAAKELGAPAERVEAALAQLAAEGRLVVRPAEAGAGPEGEGWGAPERDAIYLPELEAAEASVALRLARLAAAGPAGPVPGTEAGSPGALADGGGESATRRAVRWVAEEVGLALTPEQERAVEAGLEAGVLVITGGPGTGKTTIVRVLLALLKRVKQKVLLACPTGRAAQRLQEATGEEARTIHRLLEFGFEEGKGLVFQRNEDNPLEADVVLIDEASMVDVWLAHHLLRALRPQTRLVLIGDVDQLPSVGPGNVLRDIIESGVVPVVRLGQVFRQEEDSGIVQAAHAILHGRDPVAARVEGDFYLIEEEDPEQVVEVILDLVARRLPRYLQVDPVSDIQVLSPMRRTPTGVDNLNRLLQARLNPADGDPGAWDLPFRLGDKVMQVRNNYEKRVFNGDIGRIVEADPEEGRLRVAYPAPEGPQLVDYDDSEWDELALAYCISVHKSQGSEYPAVVMPITTQHYVMLRRNLLYTAVTRARRMAVLVGTRRALRVALSQVGDERRYSLLAPRLRQAVQGWLAWGQETPGVLPS